MHSYATVDSVYQCQISKNLNINSPEDAVIANVSGTHMSGKTNDDVLAFHADTKIIEYFPKGLERFFKNLKVFHMPRNQIKQITQSDLKPFPNLIYLEVHENNIKILEDGLFNNHPNMKVVWFNVNKIFHVGKNVFNNMNKITYLGFGSNQCVNTNVESNAAKVIELVESLKTNASMPISQIFPKI